VKSGAYKNGNLKKLVEFVQQMEEEADRDRVHKKINGLRVAYRRELITVNDSTKSGARKVTVSAVCLY
jgi:uncharacterized protein YqgV (UPF0045/DUF77 family)